MKDMPVRTASFVMYAGVIFLPKFFNVSFALISRLLKKCAPTQIGAQKDNKKEHFASSGLYRRCRNLPCSTLAGSWTIPPVENCTPP